MESIEERAMTVTTKGQVTIPIEIRRLLGVKPHDKVIFQVADGRVELRSADMTLEDTFGAVKPRKRPEDFRELHDIAIEEHVRNSSIK